MMSFVSPYKTQAPRESTLYKLKSKASMTKMNSNNFLISFAQFTKNS